MHVLLLHQNFPAQFGPLLSRLGGRPGWRFTFASRTGTGALSGVERLKFDTRGGATQQTHYFSRTFENVAWQSAAVYKALRARPDIRPDLIVAHSGFVTALPLRELYPELEVRVFPGIVGFFIPGETQSVIDVAYPHRADNAETLAAGDSFTFVTAAGNVDVLGTPPGTDGYDDLEVTAVEVDLDGLSIRVADLDDLIRMKRAAGHPKDLIEVEVLEAVRDEVDTGEH